GAAPAGADRSHRCSSAESALGRFAAVFARREIESRTRLLLNLGVPLRGFLNCFPLLRLERKHDPHAEACGDPGQSVDGRVDLPPCLQLADRSLVETGVLGKLGEGQPLPLALGFQLGHHAAHLPVRASLYWPFVLTGSGELLGTGLLTLIFLADGVDAGLLFWRPLDLPLLAFDAHRFRLPFLRGPGRGASYAVIG